MIQQYVLRAFQDILRIVSNRFYWQIAKVKRRWALIFNYGFSSLQKTRNKKQVKLYDKNALNTYVLV